MRSGINLLVIAALLAVMTSGCATAIPAGAFYTEVSLPAGGSGDVSYSKTGTATANSYFALVATGDASIATAAKNGGISRIKFVDYKVKNILGFIGEYTTVVYGD